MRWDLELFEFVFKAHTRDAPEYKYIISSTQKMRVIIRKRKFAPLLKWPLCFFKSIHVIVDGCDICCLFAASDFDFFFDFLELAGKKGGEINKTGKNIFVLLSFNCCHKVVIYVSLR